MSSGIRTDLALESRELNPDIEGVEEQTEERERMTVSRCALAMIRCTPPMTSASTSSLVAAQPARASYRPMSGSSAGMARK